LSDTHDSPSTDAAVAPASASAPATTASASRKRRALLLGALASALFLWLALRGVEDVGASLAALKGIDPRLLLLPLVASIANLAIRPWRWREIFPPADRPSFGACFAAVAAGNMANNFLPARGGDALRCLLVRRSAGGGSMAAFATLLVEKAFDGLALLLVLLLAVALLGPPGWVGKLAATSAVVFGGALACMIWLERRAEAAKSLARSLVARLGRPAAGDRAAELVGAFARGLAATGSPWRLAWIAALTGAQWATEAAILAGFAHALGVELTIAHAAVAAAIVGLGLMIPSAPGFVGTWEFFSVQALGLFAVSPEKALAIALATHAWSLAATTALGLACAGKAGRGALGGATGGSGRQEAA